MAEPLFMGLDAGGSKTVCLVGDCDTVLGRGQAGPGNPSVEGVERFRAAISEAAGQALGGRRAGEVARAWIGVAGSETPGMRAALRAAALAALGVERVSISHDGRLLLAAAGADSGIAVVAGTGSSVYGLARDGREVMVGGWGHLLGDEGSAYDISRQALRAVTQAADGRGPVTRLSGAITAALGAASPQGLRERCYPARPVAEVARLARIVLELSAADQVASAIVTRAAADLAVAIRACREQLAAGDRAEVAVVTAGGLMGERSPLLVRLSEALEQQEQRYRLLPLKVEPAAGALALARDGPADGSRIAEEEAVPKRDDQVHQQPKETLA